VARLCTPLGAACRTAVRGPPPHWAEPVGGPKATLAPLAAGSARGGRHGGSAAAPAWANGSETGTAVAAWRYTASLAVALTGGRSWTPTAALGVDGETTRLGGSDRQLCTSFEEGELRHNGRWGKTRWPGASYRQERRRSDSTACGPVRSEWRFFAHVHGDRRTSPCSANQRAHQTTLSLPGVSHSSAVFQF
jgi:hypothetical protein